MKKILFIILSIIIVSSSYGFNQNIPFPNYNIFGNIITIFNGFNFTHIYNDYKNSYINNTKNTDSISVSNEQLNNKKIYREKGKEKKIIDNNKKRQKQQDKKIILQKVISLEEIIEKKNLCKFIYNVKDIDKKIDYRNFNKRTNLLRKQFIFLDWRTKQFLSDCYKVFNLDQKDIKKINNRIIFFKEDSNKPFNLDSAIKLKTYKKYLLKQKIWLIPVYRYSYQEIEKYNYNLYNIFYKKIFSDYNLNKDFLIIDYNDYKKYKKFRKELNKIITRYISEREKFYKKYKIYQNTNPKTGYRNHDWEKCGIYALTEIITFNNYLSNVLFIISKKNITNNQIEGTIDYYLNDIVKSKKYYNKLFGKLSEVYVKDFRKKNGIGTSELDLIKYLNQFLNGFSDNNRIVYLKYKYLSDLENPYMRDLSIDIKIKRGGRWVNGGHFGLKVCNVKQQCKQYWPDLGYTEDKIKRFFYGKNRIVEYGISFSIVGYYKEY